MGEKKTRILEADEVELWRNLDRASARRDIFWVFFYADQLSTIWHDRGIAIFRPQDTIKL